ncbi:hypothetical protein SUNI508_00683 [Seiridium unicorne]|uniref:RING-type domain-containing protein n=1 Tax=Seiridium unicorne TaxID=138068 RepID=A0ABR2V8M7_9PEZI
MRTFRSLVSKLRRKWLIPGRQDKAKEAEKVPQAAMKDKRRERRAPRKCASYANQDSAVNQGIRSRAAAAMEEPASPNGADLTSCKTQVLLIFEDIDSQYLDKLAEEHSFNSDAIISDVLDKQERGQEYPRRPNPLKRKRDIDVEEEGEGEVEDPTGSIKAKIDDPNYLDQMRSAEYKDMATLLISQDFPLAPKTTIRNKLLLNNGSSLYRTYVAMDSASRDWDKVHPMWLEKKTVTKVLQQYSAAKIHDLDRSKLSADQCAALNEFIAARAVKAGRDAKEVAATAERANVERARKNGEMTECGCCFDEFPLNRMVHCEGATVHWFCRPCMTQQAETKIGYSKCDIACLSMEGCSAGFSASQKDTFLDRKLRIALNRIEAQAALQAAGIENLETCPFCPMAMEYPPVEENKEFRCTNPSCEIVSCRLCRKITHIPKTCAEAAAEEGHSARHTIEEAMSEAIIRKCNKSLTPDANTRQALILTLRWMAAIKFVVPDVVLYNAMNRGGKDGQCPLFDQTEVRHQDEVRRAEEASRSQVVKDNPELNADILKLRLSAQVEEDERKRKERGVRPAPPQIQIPRPAPRAAHFADPRKGPPAIQLEDAERHHIAMQQQQHAIRQRHDRIVRIHQAANAIDRLQVQREAERLVQHQAQQAQAHQRAAQNIHESLRRHQPDPPRVLAQALNILNAAEAVLQPRPQQAPALLRNAANPIQVDNNQPRRDPWIHRDLRNDNVFLPLFMGAELDLLGPMDELRPLPNHDLPLHAMNRRNDPFHQNILNLGGPARDGRIGQRPGAIAPVEQARGRPAARPGQRSSPANRIRDARA